MSGDTIHCEGCGAVANHPPPDSWRLDREDAAWTCGKCAAPVCRACGDHLTGKVRVQDGDEYVCLDCYGVTPRTCERVHHVEVSGEHRLCIPGVVEATTRNWGIAKVFAEALVQLAAEGR